MATQIGPLVKRLRERFHMTQQDVVDYARIERSSSYISAIETNKTSPTLYELERIAQVFRMTGVDLILEAQGGQPDTSGGESQRVVSLYERLPEDQRSLALDFLQLLVERGSK